MKIMQIGLHTLNNLGTNYFVKLNEEELLIYEEDPLRKKSTEGKEKFLKDNERNRENLSKLKDDLSDDEKRLVNDLQSRDAEVRTHESAHQAAVAGMTGAATFTYQQGPDGKMYAIGGEVSISSSKGSTPQETISKAKQIIATAMAPSDPSGQDFLVASSAMMMLMKAEQQLAKASQEEMNGKEAYGSLTAKNDTAAKDSTDGFDISA